MNAFLFKMKFGVIEELTDISLERSFYMWVKVIEVQVTDIYSR